MKICSLPAMAYIFFVQQIIISVSLISFVGVAFLPHFSVAYYYDDYTRTTSTRPPVAPRPYYYTSDPRNGGGRERLADVVGSAGYGVATPSSVFNSAAADTIRQPLRVTAVLQPPFLFAASTQTPMVRKRGDRFEGFFNDLLQRMFVERHNLSYVIRPAEEYGQPVQQQQQQQRPQWSGMIGALMLGDADVATGALTDRPARRQVVDFSVPILSGHIVLVAPRKPTRYADLWSAINSLTDLAHQIDISYGVIASGATMQFFQSTRTNEPLERMWQYMERRPDLHVRTPHDGIARVLRGDGDYAFIMESPMAQYEASIRPCELRIVEADATVNSLYKVVYAMATRLNSPLMTIINTELMSMHETGYIRERYAYWWRQDAQLVDRIAQCDDSERMTSPRRIDAATWDGNRNDNNMDGSYANNINSNEQQQRTHDDVDGFGQPIANSDQRSNSARTTANYDITNMAHTITTFSLVGVLVFVSSKFVVQ